MILCLKKNKTKHNTTTTTEKERHIVREDLERPLWLRGTQSEGALSGQGARLTAERKKHMDQALRGKPEGGQMRPTKTQRKEFSRCPVPGGSSGSSVHNTLCKVTSLPAGFFLRSPECAFAPGN